MTCRETQPLLSPFFDGELDPDQMQRVAFHSAACTECEQELHRLQGLHGMLLQQTVALVDDIDLSAMWSGIESRITNVAEPFGVRVRAWFEELFTGWPRMPVLAGSGALAMVAMLVWILPLSAPSGPTFEVANVDNSAIVNSLDSHVGSVALLNEPETNTSVLWVNDDGPDAGEFRELP